MTLSTRMALAMVALVLLTTTALGVLAYRSVEKLIMPRALDQLQTHAGLTAMVLEASLRGARADAVSAQAANGLHSLMLERQQRPAGAAATPGELDWRRRIELRFAAELTGKPEYAQMRLIGVDDDGMEIIRVDRSGPAGAIRIVPSGELKPRGDRDYFKEGVATPPNKVSILQVQLNRTSTGIEDPPVPTLRAVAPIHNPDNTVFAVLVINVDLRPAIAHIRSSARDDAQVYVVNEAGDYLVHPDPKLDFGFERGRVNRIQDDFPDLAKIILKTDKQPRLIEDRRGEWFGMGWESVQLAGGPWVTVVEASPYSRLMRAPTVISNSALIGGGTAIFCAILMAIALARSLTKPLVEITNAVEGFSSGREVVVSRGGGQEIARLAEAFSDMATKSRRTSSALIVEADERRRIAEVLRSTIDNMSDPVLVADAQGTVLITNPAARQLFGALSGVGVLNSALTFERFLPDGVTPLPPEASPLLRAFNGEAVDDFEFIVQPTGSTRRAYLVANGRPIRNKDGELQGAVTVYHDVTLTKKAQQSLLESERMARAIIDTALDAFIQINPAGAITEWSPPAETMFGWSREEAVGRHLGKLLFAPDTMEARREGYRRFVESASKGGTGYRVEIEAIRKDGSPIQIEVSLTLLRLDSGYVTNAFMRDLTEKKISEEQLRQAQKMDSIGQLTGGIAHDFNNMLTVITGTIDILSDAVADKPQIATIARLIGEAANRGAQMTKHLLAFARKQPLMPVVTDVNILLADLGELLRPTLGEAIEISSMLHNGVWPIMIDRNQLNSALINLAVNARGAMPDGGKLTLETCNVVLIDDFVKNDQLEPGNYVMIAVSDSGFGIPEAIRDKIFEPFFTTKEVGKGTGLGLAIVYGFVKQSGGLITVGSDVGRGTTFRIYLPASEAQPEWVAPAAPASNAAGGTETILLVEDDPMVRSFVATQLHGLGYRTIEAANAADALRIIDQGTAFDLLFTDIVMPGQLNGVQMAAEAAKRRSPLKVLFTSGHFDNAIAGGRLDPAALLLAKPYPRSELARMVRLALDSPTFEPAQMQASAH
jgi:PAS domain S-box-containing protein